MVSVEIVAAGASPTPTPTPTATPSGPPAAIVFDAASSNFNSTQGATLTISHTVGNPNANRILIVGAESEEPTSGNCSVTGVTFSGVALTKINEAIASDSYMQCVSLRYLLSPAAGTHDIVITWPQHTDNRSGGGISIYNAAQQGPEASNTKALSGSPSSITTSLTTLTAGAWVVDAVGSGNKGSGFTPLESGQTERYDVQASSSAGAGSTKHVATAGLTSMGWAQGANRMAHAIAAFAPFSSAPTPTPTPTATATPTPPSWVDTSYAYRMQLTITTGQNPPHKGYDGYTALLSNLNTATLVSNNKMQADCDDLRAFRHNAGTWAELDRDILSCNSAQTEVRFRLQADIGTSSTDGSYYLYYGNNSVGAGPSDLNEVYLWYDSGAANQLASYVLGRGDPWHGSGYTAFTYDQGGSAYRVDTGDNFTGSMRRQVNERDAYIEAEFFHTGCYPNNMTSGLLGRYVLSSGTGSSESSSHYYGTNRGQQASCGSGYTHDGDIMKNARGTVAVDGVNPLAVSIDQWRKQALSLSSVNPTTAKFWDSDTVSAFGPRGWPTVSANASGTDGSSGDMESAGDWGVIGAQDTFLVRNILIRRYTESEPSVGTAQEEPIGNVPTATPTPTSTPTPTPTPLPTSGTGLIGTYYDNINLTNQLVTRTDATIDFNWGSGSPDPSMGSSSFSVKWTGQVEAQFSETYTFYTTSDDGVRLYVDGSLLFDNWTSHSPTEDSGTIALTAGQKYDIWLEYFENSSSASLKLQWSSPSTSKQVVPQGRLYPVVLTSPSSNGLIGTYYDDIDFTTQKLTRTDGKIDFNWGSGSPDPSMGSSSFSVKWTGQVEAQFSEAYTFYTTSDDGVRLYVDGSLLFDNWTSHSPTEDSGTIALTAGQKYDIWLEYFENSSSASLKLEWSSASTPKEVVPPKRLYPVVLTSPSSNGLIGTYYDDINFTTQKLTRTDGKIDFNWGSGSPDPSMGSSSFSVKWTGQVEAQFSETYTFYTTSDDGVRLYVDGSLLFDNWTSHSPTEDSGTIALTAGQKYDIWLEYFENSSSASLKLEWSSASAPKEVVPPKRLYPVVLTSPSSNGLIGTYYDSMNFTTQKFIRTDGKIDFNWGSGSPDPSMGSSSFSVKWTGQVEAQFSETYTFYTLSDDGVQLYVNGQLLIDNWTNHSATEDSGSITLVAGQKYSIAINYYENSGQAVIRLLWSSPSTTKQVVPPKQLFP